MKYRDEEENLNEVLEKTGKRIYLQFIIAFHISTSL